MLNVSNLPESVEATEAAMNLPSGGVSLPPLSTTHTLLSVRESMGAEEEPLIQTVECRICQEEDNISNLESPCACTGSLKVFIHPSTFLCILCTFSCKQQKMKSKKKIVQLSWLFYMSIKY